jgi:hypothetical protein
MQNLVEFVHLKKFLFSYQNLLQKMWCIEIQLYVFLITYYKRFH